VASEGATTSAGHRFRELDALRGVAALAIVLWHYGGHFRAYPLFDLLMPLYQAGQYAVDFFFVLSGFVLARAYWNDRRRRSLPDNIVRRLARIYPLHLVTLLLVAAGQLLLTQGMDRPPFVTQENDLRHFLLNLALAQNLGLESGFSFNGPAWSISTELYVNILFFVLLAYAGRRVGWVFAGLVLVSLGLLAGTGNGSLIRSGEIFFVSGAFVRTVLGFFLGVLLHESVQWLRDRGIRPSWLMDLLFAATAGYLVLYGRATFGLGGPLAYSTVLLCFPILIVSAIRSRVTKVVLCWRPFTYLGDISYSLYLIHFPVQLLIHILKASGLLVVAYWRPSTLLVFLAVCLALAALSHRYLELPLQGAINDWWFARRREGSRAI